MRVIALLTLAWTSVLSGQSGSDAAPPPSPRGPMAPIGAWTVVPDLPGMGRAVETTYVAARRRALAARIGRGVILVPAAHERNLEADYVQDNDFRQHNTFYYLTELETQDSWLLIIAQGPESTDVALFLPARTPGQERWTGIRLGPDSVAARLSGIATVLPVDSLERRLQVARFRVHGPVYVPLDESTRDEKRIADLTFGSGDVRNLRPIVDSMRLVKDADELARLRTAVNISVAGHVAAMQAAKPGMYEYQIEAAFEGRVRSEGADRLGYPSIVGSGPNSTTLHYDTNRRQTRDGDLVVVDAAAEYGQYTADITRTWPVNGKFTPRQKAIYDLVLASQQAAFGAVRPGIQFQELDRTAREYMRAHSGDLCGATSCDSYFIHSLGHWIGMDVHDVGGYARPLAPGMVLTLEPGIYLPSESLGVRIEDDVLVTANGGEWLSAGAPRTTAEIEKLMREGKGR